MKRHPNHLPAAAAVTAVLTLILASLPASAGNRGRRLCLTTRPSGLSPATREWIASQPDAFDFRYAWKAKAATAKRERKMLEKQGVPAIQAAPGAVTAVTGTLNLPVLLVQFDGSPGAPNLRASYDALLNVWSNSLSAYYQEVSYGLFDVSSTVTDWVQVSGTSRYYTQEDDNGRGPGARTGEFIAEVVALADPGIDFGQFDNDGIDGVPNSGDDDGFVDVLCIVQELLGAEGGGVYQGIPARRRYWSHRWGYTAWENAPLVTDDPAAGGGRIRIQDYLICSAVEADGSLPGPGIFAHELGHALGIGDLYDIEEDGSGCFGDSSEGIGHWGLMGNGDKNTSDSPAHMTAWTKDELGWLTPEVVESNRPNWPIASASTGQVAYKLWTAGHVAKEYFLVELRTQDGFDSALQQEGILIWHVDERELDELNANECHPLLDLECANQTALDHILNHDDLAANGVRSSADHVWTDGMSFSNISTPSNVAYDGHNTRVKVDVSYDAGMDQWYADLIVGLANVGVDLCVRDCEADACGSASWCDVWWASPDIYVDNNGNGTSDPPLEGAINTFKINVRNVGTEDAQNVVVDLYMSVPIFGRQFYQSFNVPIGTGFISTIPAFGEEIATIDAPVPNRYGDIERFFYAAVAHSDADMPGFLDPIFENNMAILNRVEFFNNSNAAPAPVTEPGSGPSTAGPTPPVTEAAVTFESSHTIVAVNSSLTTSETMAIRAGSPPLYDDVVQPVGWQYFINPDTLVVGPGDSVDVLVTALKNNPVHGDQMYLPLTASSVSGDSIISGVVLQWTIDNVPPAAPLGLNARLDLRGGSDDAPLERAATLTWQHSGLDINGNPDVVESWEVYADTVPNFPPAPALLVEQFAVDRDPDTPGMQARVDVPTLGPNIWYRVFAIDGAGNRSPAAVAALQILVPTGIRNGAAPAAPLSVLLYPNPASGWVHVDVSVDRPGDMKIDVYDVAGRRVHGFTPGRVSDRFAMEWNRRDNAGRPVASGIYFVRVEHAGHVATRKLVLVR